MYHFGKDSWSSKGYGGFGMDGREIEMSMREYVLILGEKKG